MACHDPEGVHVAWHKIEAVSDHIVVVVLVGDGELELPALRRRLLRARIEEVQDEAEPIGGAIT